MSDGLDDLFDHYDVKEIRRVARGLLNEGFEGDRDYVELNRIASLIEDRIGPPAPDHPRYDGWGGLLSRDEIETMRMYGGISPRVEAENREMLGRFYDEDPPRPRNAFPPESK